MLYNAGKYNIEFEDTPVGVIEFVLITISPDCPVVSSTRLNISPLSKVYVLKLL